MHCNYEFWLTQLINVSFAGVFILEKHGGVLWLFFKNPGDIFEFGKIISKNCILSWVKLYQLVMYDKDMLNESITTK